MRARCKQFGMSVQLERVKPTSDQIVRLFHQLENRAHGISHKQLPSFEAHRHFVESSPYRAWFIIKRGDVDLGSIYVQFDNSVGINCSEDVLSSELGDVLERLYIELTPLEAIPSVRFGDFFLNVASTNLDLQKKLVDIGYCETQRTFVVSRVRTHKLS